MSLRPTGQRPIGQRSVISDRCAACYSAAPSPRGGNDKTMHHLKSGQPYSGGRARPPPTPASKSRRTMEVRRTTSKPLTSTANAPGTNTNTVVSRWPKPSTARRGSLKRRSFFECKIAACTWASRTSQASRVDRRRWPQSADA